jgi:hypothetical protein
MGTVVPFPSKVAATAIRIPLYGEDEVNFTVGILNMFGADVVLKHPLWAHPGTATKGNLRGYSPHFVIEAFRIAHNSGLFSTKGKRLLERILANVEQVSLTKEG